MPTRRSRSSTSRAPRARSLSIARPGRRSAKPSSDHSTWQQPNASPIVANRLVAVGWSPAEGASDGQGGFALLDVEIVKETTTTSAADQAQGFAGGGLWNAPAYDPSTQVPLLERGQPGLQDQPTPAPRRDPGDRLGSFLTDVRLDRLQVPRERRSLRAAAPDTRADPDRRDCRRNRRSLIHRRIHYAAGSTCTSGPPPSCSLIPRQHAGGAGTRTSASATRRSRRPNALGAASQVLGRRAGVSRARRDSWS